MSVHSLSFSGISNNSPYYSHGQIKLIKSVSSYTWTINNFSICRKKTGEVIDSPVISGGADGDHKWRILLYPKGRNEDSKDYVSIFLFLLSCTQSKVEVQVKFSILNEKNDECNERRVEEILHRGKGIGCSDFIKRDFILDKSNGLLPKGNLIILCEINTGSGPVMSITANLSNVVHELSISEKQMSDDLEHLLDSEKYSDATLRAHGQEFKVHKNVLSARSSVFATMFENNSKQSKFDLGDVEPDVLREILRFIYSSKVENLARMAQPLFVAADKYHLQALKTLCEDALCKNLTIDNAVETLLLADVNKAEKLKGHIIGFIIAHSKEVIESPGYKLIAESDQWHLLANVFQVLALQNH